ncbi:MAG: alanine--glyoxylate aminotransferase family protein [Opitutales bacterium]
MIDYKLFIPGPVNVSEDTYRAMSMRVMGHRSPDFVELYRAVQPNAQRLFGTEDPVFLSTSSAWGVMEGAVRNLCSKKVLNCMCGAFSDKWHDVSNRCGKDAGKLQVEWGRHIDPSDLRQALSTGEYDVVTLVHNETSCGMVNPLKELIDVIHEFPEVISVVDTVSSFSAVPIPKDELGIDVMLTGSQKALAMPPGLALLSVSEKAMRRAEQVERRGYYFDFLEFRKNHEKGMTPSTPAIPLIHALNHTLGKIFDEGMENRFARHARLNDKVRGWATRNGFELFPQEEYASRSLTCVKNVRGLDVASFVEVLKQEKKFSINGGYGKIKGQTFRISNMGDETDESIDALLDALDELLPRFLPPKTEAPRNKQNFSNQIIQQALQS